VAWFRFQADRVRHALTSASPASRWLLALGVFGVLGLAGYVAMPVSGRSGFLRNGQKFSIGDVIKISHALDLQHIAYRVDDQRRIEVAGGQLGDASSVLAKLDIGPRSIEDLEKEAQASGLLDGPWEKERREKKGQEQILAAMIREFDGIISAYVTISQPRPRIGLSRPGTGNGPGMRTTAFVWLETEGGREISHKTVQSIQNLVVGKEPELRADAVTVFDQKGRHYLVAGDPSYSTLSATRAREEELGQRLLDVLDWIGGVRVTVQLVSAPTSAPVTLPTLSAAPTAPVVAPSSSLRPRAAGPAVGVNTPLELEPDPGAVPDVGVVAPSAPTPVPVVSSPSVPEPPGPKHDVARVWVRVPRSYYDSKAAPNRDLSPERQKEIVRQTESLIAGAVEHVVPPELRPPGEPIDLQIDTLPAGEVADAPFGSRVVDATRGQTWWWLPAAAGGGGVIVLLSAVGIGVVVLAGRRRPDRSFRVAAAVLRPTPGTTRYRRDAAAEMGPGRGPGERVRELIRLSPEAAAGVLNRWIGQGESRE
jgi:flagellar biosynthesis/type III secretory pathway M-ring protein FliF/YscJ